MSHGPEHQIEHAEHAAHAVHNPFDKRVTITIAIVAAVLAGVTMLGHRSHNDTLLHQGDALGHQTRAGIEHNLAANAWAKFQATNIRSHFYQSLVEQAGAGMLAADKDAKGKAALERWQGQVEKYEKKNLPEAKDKAEKHETKGQEHEKSAEAALAKSHFAHAKSTRFDLGELALQLGVVLCSLAILTKARAFWFLGIACAVVGFVVAMTGQFDVLIHHANAGH
ncbi:MAG: DUF4337 domain-containing protein [Gemmataceae bacterium]|nr:DUF4337 domain-containing protein [Gemmataceae bacterium]